MKIMDRIETVDYLKSKIHNERLAVSRYGDGEYLLMNKMVGQKTENKERISPFLLEAIKVKGQLVCIPFLKPHNLENKDIWYKAQKFLVETSQHKLYGNAMWNIYDFLNDNSILPFLFSKKTILVTGYPDESRAAFKDLQPDLKVIPAPLTNASEKYEQIKLKILDYNNQNKADNMIFACGAISEVLISDLIGVVEANLVDLGSVLNAILNDYAINKKPLVQLHRMSWVKAANIKKQSDMFFKKLEKIGG